jgi:hypothetical protein
VNSLDPLSVHNGAGVQPEFLAVAAVVVNYNGGERVLRVVEALLRQSYPLADFVVVDNASTDGSPERVRQRFPQVRVLVQEDNKGLSTARNVGLRAVQAPLVLLLDHDVYVEPCAIREMVQAYLAEAPAVVCPRVRLLPERDIVQAEGAAVHFLGMMILRHDFAPVNEVPRERAIVDGCIGACMLVARDRVLAAGGFDELFFFYFEDLEFSLRLRARGLRFLCEPHAEVFHERGQGTPGLSFRGVGQYPKRRAYFTMRHRLLIVLMHYRWRTLLVLLPVLGLCEAATLAVAVRRGWLTEWASAWSWQFRNLRTVLRRRRVTQASRTLPDRQLLVGGPPPLSPGFVGSAVERRLVEAFSAIVNGYWSVARRWIG